jgi:protein-disulfide isomerase
MRAASALRNFLQLALAAALVVPVGCETKADGDAAAPKVKIDGQRFRVGLFDDDLALGGDEPLVTIVVFTDYACPPCGRTWQVMDHLVEDYGADVRVVLRSFTVPGFERGEQASEAAFAASAQGKFWEMHRRLFEHATRFDRPSLLAHAEALGLDTDKFLDDLDTGVHAGRRIRHRRQAKELGVLGLPAIFVNGLFVAGYHDEKVWHGIIDGEIEVAKEMMAGGVRRGDLYAEHLSKAKTGRVQVLDDQKALKEELAKKAAPAIPKDLRPPDAASRYDVPLAGAPAVGPEDAPIVIVEFVDFRCPYCRRAWKEELGEVMTAHAADVRLVVLQLPLEIHPEAHGAALAGLAADRQGAFESMHAALLAHEGPLGRSHFVEYAKAAGIDEAKFLADLDDPVLAQQVATDMRTSVALGITGTPAFFVNGRFLGGFRPGALRSLVDEELTKAAELTAAGTPRAEIARALLGPAAVTSEGFPNR